MVSMTMMAAAPAACAGSAQRGQMAGRAAAPLRARKAASLPRRTLTVRAKQSNDGGDGFEFNIFKNKKKEEDARKAIMGAFEGKKDPFAGSGKPPKDGGGFGGFSFDGGAFWRSIVNFMKGVGSFLAALSAFALLIYLLSFWQQAVALVGLIFTKIFRLDAGQRNIATAGTTNLEHSLDDDKREFGLMEESVIAKYGGDDAGADADEGDEGDEEDF